MKKDMFRRSEKYFILIVFLVFLVLGIKVYKDYGISSDELTERESTVVNAKYVMDVLGIDTSGIEVPELSAYPYRYYGTVLQMPTMILEAGGRELREIFQGRHLYTFVLCMIGYAAFFFLCKTIFRSNLAGLTGAMMVALYPRFFAEQFYNIKDMVFTATFMIAMLFSVKLIESRFKLKWMLAFVVSAVISTNVRIVGIIFLILMLGYLLIDYILGDVVKAEGYERQCQTPFLCGLIMVVTYLAFFILLMPAIWGNPAKGIIEVFAKFSQYDDWDSTIVFMGNVLSKSEIPWYYIPVWILISVPVWYILLSIITVVVSIWEAVRHSKAHDGLVIMLFSRYKYVVWCVLLAAVPWLGIVFMHSTLYNGWRHCYFFVPVIVLFSLFGVNFLIKKGKKYFVIVAAVVVLGLGVQSVWIWNNHPFEMVYLNSIGKHFGAYFDRDYWHVATLNAFRYIEENEPEEKLSVKTSGNDLYMYMLEDDERNRIAEEEEPLYYIETYRGKVGNELKKDGYEEVYSIIVDGYKVSTIYKKAEAIG